MKDFEDCCYVCLRKSRHMHLIYTPFEDGAETPYKMLAKLTGHIPDTPVHPALPDGICKSCGQALNSAFQLRKRFLQSHRVLQDFLKRLPSERTLSDVDDHCYANSSEYEDHIPIEELLPIATVQPISSIAVSIEAPSEDLNKGKPEESIKQKQDDRHMCDICGNTYTKRGRLNEHRRLHNKELTYACELCDKRFYQRELLRRHIFTHRGSKPFNCAHCSRTFFYESVKKSHEAVHNGYKPYVCGECSKAFAYPHALKKHRLTHTEIKLYHCVYCDKDFRLQHHLKQHEETKAHQKIVETQLGQKPVCSISRF